METCWATLKREIAHILWPDRDPVQDSLRSPPYLFEFIEVFYNRQCHRAGLGLPHPSRVRRPIP